MAYNEKSLDSFICYYLYMGFATLYLYLDDPADATVAVARRYPAERVKVRLHDASLKREWQSLPSWPRLALYSHREVQARQMLNCEHAIARCRASGEQWLLHVDSDEMLFLPSALANLRQAAPSTSATADTSSTPAPGAALQAHLSELDAMGAILFTYRNLEAVPEALECADPYRTVSLFKQHPSILDRTPTSEARARAIAYWTDVAEAGGELFRFYANGKSIVRVCDAIQEAGSVHEWNLPSREAAATAAFTNHPALGLSSYVYHRLMRVREVGGAVLLHFACCSFATFWAKRWAALGYASPNHRFRGGGGGLDQRANALALGARKAEAETFYRRSMMCDDLTETTRQLAAGVCVRITVGEMVETARTLLLPNDSSCHGGAVSGAVGTTALTSGSGCVTSGVPASSPVSKPPAPLSTATMQAIEATVARERHGEDRLRRHRGRVSFFTLTGWVLLECTRRGKRNNDNWTRPDHINQPIALNIVLTCV